MKEFGAIFYNQIKQTFSNPRIVAALFIFFVVMWLWGEAAWANWWLIDDHEIFWLTGKNGQIRLIDIWGILVSRTEFGSLGSGTRFRLGYYPARIVEKILWQDLPHIWHIARLLFAFLVSFALFDFLSIFLPLVLSFFSVLFLLAQPMWFELWVRLGPGETYGALGLAMFWLLFRFMQTKSTDSKIGNNFFATLAGIFLILAVTSKENMLPFSLLSMLFFLPHFSPQSSSTRIVPKIGFLVSVFLAINALIVVRMILRMKNNVYGQSVDATGVLFSVANWMGSYSAISFWFSIFLILISTFLVLKFRDKSSGFGRLITLYVLLSLFIWHLLFYKGQYPTGMRYDFPGSLIVPLIIILASYEIIGIAKNFISQWHHEMAVTWQRRILLVFLVSCVFYNFQLGKYQWHRDSTRSYVNRTGEFRRSLNEVIFNNLAPNTDNILIVTDSQSDYEAVYSLRGFLHGFNALSKPLMLFISNTEVREPPLLRNLWSQQNSTRDGFVMFEWKDSYSVCIVFRLDQKIPFVCKNKILVKW